MKKVNYLTHFAEPETVPSMLPRHIVTCSFSGNLNENCRDAVKAKSEEGP